MRWILSAAFPSNYAPRIINLADTRVIDAPISSKITADIACIVRHIREADAIIIASPVYDGLLHDTPANLLCNLPADAVAGKPLGFVTTGGLGNQSLTLKRQLRSILEWWEPVIVPCGVHLTTADCSSDMLSENARLDLAQLANTIARLLEVAAR
jgi:FMN reductase